jgi:uncharacterized protein YkwD
MSPHLKPLAALSTAARRHAEWLAKKRNLLTYKTPHKGNKGSTLSQRIWIKNCGPAENVGWLHLFDSKTRRVRSEIALAKAILKRWMASAGHKKNIVDQNLKYLGVGAAIWKRGKRANWRVVLVQNFSENSGPADAAKQDGSSRVTVFE